MKIKSIIWVSLFITIYTIINDIIDKSCDKIITEIYIKEIYVKNYGDIRILCSYEEYTREWERFHSYNDKDFEIKNKNENEIKYNCKIIINSNEIPFCYHYKFKNKRKIHNKIFVFKKFN